MIKKRLSKKAVSFFNQKNGPTPITPINYRPFQFLAFSKKIEIVSQYIQSNNFQLLEIQPNFTSFLTYQTF